MTIADHRRRSQRTQILLRAALIVSLWQAPVPWVHAHDDHAGDHPSDAALCDHLAQFHRDRQSAVSGAWHVHFLLPSQIAGGADKEDRDDPLRSRATPGWQSAPEARSCASLLSVTRDFAGSQRLAASVSADCSTARATERTGGFLSTYASSVRLNVLICVARC